jgi:diguanylate cyclase (GGDEF)-like protein
MRLLLEGRGTQFDPIVIDTFIEHLPEFEAEIAEELTAEAVAQAQIRIAASEQLRGNQATPAAGLATEPVATRSSTHYLNQIKSAHFENISLYEITRSISSARDLEKMVDAIREKVSPLVPFDTCVLFIHQTTEQMAVARAAAGRGAGQFRGSRIAFEGGVTGFVLAERQIFSNTDPVLDFAALGVKVAENYQNVISCPLVKDDTLIGALTLYSLKADCYTADHIRLLETISANVAEAVFNALHHSSDQDQAATDPLTELPNARHLTTCFATEVHRADRYGYPLMLMMLDLDDFKRINDSHGHDTGDRLLREVAKLLASQVRRGDILVRYTADEFVALLHRMTPDLINDLTARIQLALADWRFEADPNQTISVSASLGCATYGKDGRSLPELMQAAAERLQQQKERRRLEAYARTAGKLKFFPGTKRGL